MRNQTAINARFQKMSPCDMMLVARTLYDTDSAKSGTVVVLFSLHGIPMVAQAASLAVLDAMQAKGCVVHASRIAV